MRDSGGGRETETDTGRLYESQRSVSLSVIVRVLYMCINACAHLCVTGYV